ncbi:MAG: CocE/NonD family hydrolase [Xanthobacteraceae bacterium]|nr:CocE/NonD family hydrolase [Xanthobacteraceae bacterium]
MKKWLLMGLFSLLSAFGWLYAARYEVAGWAFLPFDGIRPAEHRVCVEHGVATTAPDGVVLRADVHRPCALTKAPTILVRIPFSRGLKNELGAGALAHYWAARGYNTVIQGTRGRYKSGGTYYPLRNERADGIATLEWLKRQPWFDGRLATWGASAYGYTQWAISDQNDLRALNIQIASSRFGAMFHQGGAFALESALYWALYSRGAVDVVPSVEMIDRGVRGWPLIEADDRSAENVAFFDDWLTHTPSDDYWREIDGIDRARKIVAPVLLMAGWLDPFLPTQLQDFVTIRREAAPHVAAGSRLIVGPWTHADTIRFPDGTTPGDYRSATVAPSIPWFDHHLQGRPLAASLTAPVQIYVMGENVWRAEQEWPVARAKPTAYYLASPAAGGADRKAGRLLIEAPKQAEPPATYIYDPNNPVPTRGGAMLGWRAGIKEQSDVEARADVLLFTSDPLPAELEVTGPVSAVLHVGTSARNTDFTVKLVDVHPDGKAYNVTDGIMRRSYPAGAPSATEITVELAPTSMLFRIGHRLRVEVSSSNFPRFDRNPNTGGDIARETKPIVANQTLFLGRGVPSRIILPIVPR